MAEAFGDVGLHPWELWEYTWSEYIARRKGRMSKERREFQQVRLLCWYTILPHLKESSKKKGIDAIIPDIYSSKQTKPKPNYLEIREKYRKAGVIKPKDAGKEPA